MTLRVRVSTLFFVCAVAAGCASPHRIPAQQVAEEVVVYSGSFDPPHLGHETIIRQAVEQLGARKIYVLVNVTGTKIFRTDYADRKRMLELTTQGVPADVVIMPVKQDEKNALIAELAKTESCTPLQVIGQDSFEALDPAVADDATRRWVVVPRPDQAKKPLPHADNVSILEGDIFGHSSTKVRKAIAEGSVEPGLINPAVIDYIDAHMLYGSHKCRDAFDLKAP